MESLSGQAVLITGGGKGIGRGIALAFAKAGADVAIIGRTIEELEKTVEEVKSLGVKAFAAKTDITNESEVEKAVNDAVGRLGKIDFLVNNAGTFLVKPIMETTVDEWDYVFDVNLRGMFLCTRSVLRHMIKAKRGTIFNISSVGGRMGLKGKAAYCASKHGVVGFSRAIAKELKEHHIKVHVIYPYYVDSNNTHDFSDPDKALKMNKVEDIADLIIYLATCPLRVSIEEIEIDPFIKGKN
jgi:NAD(P)-dependent dehydrogenase (short-subunit alcohol dehydrogenase family)